MNECECSANYNYSQTPLIFLVLYLGNKCSSIILKRGILQLTSKTFLKINNIPTKHDRKLNTHQTVFMHPFMSLKFQGAAVNEPTSLSSICLYIVQMMTINKTGYVTGSSY